jgi:thioredoxin-dependent peroxiredoxin
MLRVGQKAPDFSAPAHDGRTVRLSEYEGKTVVLWFYPRASTGG